MSLKAFHIFFICASIVLAVGFGWWAIRLTFWVGVASLIASVLLAVYLFWFLKKIKTL